ncbi:uncharacterized protein M6B38_158410 [Iris pallida]|uniref:TRAF-type domain-containing protein n=1 Tax=Iris pallida TaxID=29817 RepID=A0AAX6F263_IRIPA|nr:uncharacterized protein M6B38_158410 [Iris pallida]
MDQPITDPGPTKDSAPPPTFPCPHSDSELVHRLAQLLLPGLAAACVDSTTGDPFRSPGSVAVDLRRDLIDLHLLPLSQTFVPDTLSLLSTLPSDEPPDPDLPDLDSPSDILSYLLEQFASSRRTVLGRVSNWLLSDSREDKIDDFVQELELTNFWKLARRESVADALLKNLDYKNKYHCSDSFQTQQELDDHAGSCPFRPVECASDGCKVRFCKMHEEKHDAACLYKVLECEQGCGGRVVRREMDRHCVTVCRRRMANCPFYQVGCESAFAMCELEDHCDANLRPHLVCVLKVAGKEEDEAKDLAERMEKSEFRNRLAAALSVRSLTYAAKDVERKLPPPQPKKLEVDLDKDISRESDASLKMEKLEVEQDKVTHQSDASPKMEKLEVDQDKVTHQSEASPKMEKLEVDQDKDTHQSEASPKMEKPEVDQDKDSCQREEESPKMEKLEVDHDKDGHKSDSSPKMEKLEVDHDKDGRKSDSSPKMEKLESDLDKGCRQSEASPKAGEA